MGFFGWICIALVLSVAFLAWWSPKSKEAQINKEKSMTSREVALLCTTDMATTYHIHPEIKIISNGVEIPIPGNMGVQQICMTSIHTHDPGGVIHIESPIQKDFTLGDFFAVWKKSYSNSVPNVIKEGTMGKVTVNSVSVSTYEDTVFRDKDKLVITY